MIREIYNLKKVCYVSYRVETIRYFPSIGINNVIVSITNKLIIFRFRICYESCTYTIMFEDYLLSKIKTTFLLLFFLCMISIFTIKLRLTSQITSSSSFFSKSCKITICIAHNIYLNTT